jgi:tetratricopeptide (TPR) repeat protein
MPITNLGVVEKKLQHYDEALAQFERARDLCVRSLGPNHPWIGTIDASIGNVFLASRRPERAVESFRNAVTLFERTVGPDHSDTASTWIGLGNAYIALGDEARAVDALRRGLAIKDSAKLPEARAAALWLEGRQTHAKVAPPAPKD